MVSHLKATGSLDDNDMHFEPTMLDDTDLISAAISMTDTLPLEQPTSPSAFEAKVSFSFQPFAHDVEVYCRRDVRSIIASNHAASHKHKLAKTLAMNALKINQWNEDTSGRVNRFQER